jgi:hydrogenase nickel incorporation protein HypA/HybF
MHEMSIASALLDAVRAEASAYPDARVQTVRVRIGALRLVVPEMLDFAFVAATRDTSLDGCRLEMETVGAVARCRRCDAEFAVEQNWFVCPHCATTGGVLVRGDELDLIGVELQEPSQSRSVTT